ncbi:Uncharacterized protein APZ42_031554 [Daphnia magna]|uniref:Uncharacterized protein n=1 Tax=Daphnia magna TaxID=35525 RepID=A0A162DBA5_9CRUS|nr:Uncharacterized protein APZ42_031554 [Daphnia magna]
MRTRLKIKKNRTWPCLVTMAYLDFEEYAALVEDEEGVNTSDASTKLPSLPPATIPMPSFTVNTWPKWRSHFFQNWRKNPIGKIFGVSKLCHKYFAGDKKYFTNFKVHCTLVHKDEWDSFSSSVTPLKSKPSMVNLVYPTKPVSKGRKDSLDQSVIRLISEEHVLLHIVNRPGFRTFMQGLLAVPGYQLPSTQRVRNTLISDLKATLKKQVMEKIMKFSRFTTILDIWSSNNMSGCIGFTCQAVTTDFELLNCFSGVKEMRSRHTADAIIAEYEDILQNRDIHLQSNMIPAHFNGFPGWKEDEAQLFDEELPEMEARLVHSLQPVAESTGDMEMVELELDLEDPYGVFYLDVPLSDEDILEVVGDGEDVSEIQDIGVSLEDTYLFQAPTWMIHADEQHYVLSKKIYAMEFPIFNAEQVYSAHSTWGASASKAASVGLSIDLILKTGSWTSESVFSKHYNPPIKKESFGRHTLSIRFVTNHPKLVKPPYCFLAIPPSCAGWLIFSFCRVIDLGKLEVSIVQTVGGIVVKMERFRLISGALSDSHIVIDSLGKYIFHRNGVVYGSTSRYLTRRCTANLICNEQSIFSPSGFHNREDHVLISKF